MRTATAIIAGVIYTMAHVPTAHAGPASATGASQPRAITAPGPEGDLAGTLIPAAKDQPIVLIIPGSGPTDRDGNNPLGVTAASYRLLAEGLAQRGIGTLRIDKRGMFGSAAAVADANDFTIADYAADIATWIAAVRAETGAACLWLFGHSEGGLLRSKPLKRQRACAVSFWQRRPAGQPGRSCESSLPPTPPMPRCSIRPYRRLTLWRRANASQWTACTLRSNRLSTRRCRVS